MATINISKKSVVEKDGMVIMPVAEYNRLFMAKLMNEGKIVRMRQ